MFDSAIQANKQSGGSPEDLQKTLAAKYEDYKKTDDYKNLSADQKSKLDAFVARGRADRTEQVALKDRRVRRRRMRRHRLHRRPPRPMIHRRQTRPTRRPSRSSS